MENIIKNILNDIRVELADEFDRNFERKGFFGQQWKPTKFHNNRGSLMLRSGSLRRSIRSSVNGNSVRFSSSLPYAAVHNDGWNGMRKAHKRVIKRNGKSIVRNVRSHHVNIPQRRFIGYSPEVEKMITDIINENVRIAVGNMLDESR